MNWSVIGFDQHKHTFMQLVQDQRLVHAYLFSGPDMIGKKRFANDLYRATGGDVQVDLMTVAPRVSEGESKIYIDDVREIISFISRRPVSGPYKFVIIDHADQLTLEASNALLKILEEPPAYAVFILVSSQPKLLPHTILSRCQEVRFLPHSAEIIDRILQERSVAANDRELLRMIADGRLGWVMSAIESDSISAIRTGVHDFEILSKKSIAERLMYAKKFVEKDTYPAIVQYWLLWTHAHLTTTPPNVLRSLLYLNYILSQPQYNHRLAIENFLIHL